MQLLLYIVITQNAKKIFDEMKTINNIIITKESHAYKGCTNSYNVEILNSFNPELQLKNTESAIKKKLKNLLSELRWFKFVMTLVIQFKKIESDNATKYSTFYSNSKAEIIINESNIEDVFKSIYSMIISNIQKSLGKDSGWIIDSVADHTISISKYKPLASSSYIKLPKDFYHPKKGLINIQNINDKECLNGIWLDIYILQIIIQQELERLIKIEF